MAIWVTGDCHGDFGKFNMECFPEQKEATANDLMVICGDFGGVWARDETVKGKYGWKDENRKLDWLAEKPYVTAFVDGNHENHARLAEFPEKEWHGGKVHEIRPNVLHLMRGQVYDFDGATFLAFGGASSHDVGHGILDPETNPNWKQDAKRLERDGIWDFRTKGYDWWPEESFASMSPETVEEQKAETIRNLDAVGWKVRYVFTHELPASVVALYGRGFYKPDEHSKFLEEIRSRLDYFRWFAGHYHDEKQVTEREAILYDQIVRIW